MRRTLEKIALFAALGIVSSAFTPQFSFWRQQAAPFAGPLSLTGLTIWLDAQDAANTLQVDGVTSCNADNQVIGQWNNKAAGPGVDPWAGTTGVTYKTSASGIWGHPAIHFSGGDFMAGNLNVSSYV